MKHTPGPWHFHANSEDYTEYDIEPHGWGRYIEIKDRTNEGLANARLIAAAPDLLGACKVAHDAILGVCQAGWGPGQIESYLKELNKAINKAEGR